jgi:hypothetical protein
METPLANSRWVWLSVVRAPMALQLIRSAMFRRAGQSELIDAQENRSSQFQAGGNVAGAVQVGIVDQTFPADGGSRFLKIGSHDDQEPVTQLVCEWF